MLIYSLILVCFTGKPFFSAWETVCTELRDRGLDLCARRCRERILLLLDHFRQRDSVLRKSGSAEEYKEKERLLEELTNIKAECEYILSGRTKCSKREIVTDDENVNFSQDTLRSCSNYEDDGPNGVNDSDAPRAKCSRMSFTFGDQKEDIEKWKAVEELRLKSEEIELRREELEFNKLEAERHDEERNRRWHLEERQSEFKMEMERKEKELEIEERRVILQYITKKVFGQ
ncbi:Uncharacterised protein r2_g727 [Pycnogonum litorale]